MTVGCANQAVAQTWQDGGVANGSYNETTNWSTNVLPGDATFSSGGTTTITVSGPISPNSWTFDSSSQSYSISGGDVSFAGAGLVNNAGAGQTITIGNNILGGAVSQSGAATLVLSGNNSYSGDTTINAGVLQAGSTTAFSANSNYIVGTGSGTATLDLNGNNNTIGSLSSTGSGGVVTNTAAGTTAILTSGGNANSTFSGNVVDGAGIVGLTKNGNGTLTLSGTNTYSGDTTINTGTLQAGSTTAFSANSNYIVQNWGTLDLNGNNNTIGSLSGDTTGTVKNTAGGTTAILTSGGNANSTFSGNIVDGGGVLGLTKAGTGTLTLSGANTYSGDTTINAGTLKAGSTTAFSANSAYTVNGTLDLNGNSNTISSLSGSGTVTNTAAGTTAILTSGGNANSTFSGNVVDGAGILGLTKNGNGTLTLSGTNTYSGDTTINTGTLRAGSTTAFSANSNYIVQNWGTLDLNGNNSTIGSLSGDTTGTVKNTAGATTAILTSGGNANSTFSGNIVDGGGVLGLTKAGTGTLTLSGANTYSGATTVGAGVLQSGVANAFSANSATTVDNGGTLDLGGFAQTINTVNLAGGTLKNGTLAGAVTSNGGTVNNIGGTASLATNGGTNTILNGTNSFATTTIAGTGAVINNGSLTSTVSNSASFRNNGTLTGSLTQSGPLLSMSDNYGTITGTVSVTGGTFRNDQTVQGATTNNGGTVFNAGGTLADVTNTSGTFNNAASSNAGAVTNSGSASNLGTIASLSNTGGTFQNNNTGIVNGASTLLAGFITNVGQFLSTVSLTGGTFTNNAGGSVSGTTTNNGGTVKNNGGTFGAVTNTAGTFNNTTGNAGAVTNAATATNGGTIASLANTGTFTNNVGGLISGTATNNGGSITNTGGNFGAVTNTSGTFDNTTGTAGAVSNAATATNGGTIALLSNIGGTFTNNAGGSVSGTTTIGGGTVTNNGGTFGAVTNTIGTFDNTTGNAGAVTNAATGTNGGTIASLLNIGGTFTNSGTITGAATISGGTLALTGTGSVTGSVVTVSSGGTFDISGTTASGSSIKSLSGDTNGMVLMGSKTLTITAANDTFAGSIGSTGGTDTGGLILSGGTQKLTGTSHYTGATTINGGTLEVDGSIAASSNVTVNAGGTLSGIGIVDPTTTTVAAGGTLAPGNASTPTGTLTISGSLAFQSGAIYLVQLNTATSGNTNVTGSATLGGATVNAQFANGSYVSKQYTILTAGSVTGTFGSLVNTNLPAGFTTSLSYDGSHAYLNLALSFTPTPPTPPAPPSPPGFGGGLPGNQQAVGNALINFFNSNGSIPLVFGTLTPAGLTQISGEGATTAQHTTFNAMNQFMNVLLDPFIAGRGEPIGAGGTPTGPIYYADETPARTASKSTDAFGLFTKAPLASVYEPRWSVWAAAFGGSQTTDGNVTAGSNNTRSSILGTAVGADYWFSPDTIAGFALAGGGTNFSVNGLGNGRSDLFQAGGFIRHDNGAAYVTGALAYGWQDVTTDRIVTVAGLDHLHAEFNANTWSGRVEGGYRLVTSGFGFTPYAAWQFTTFNLPAYVEQALVGANTFALSYNSKSVTDTRSELGMRTDKSFAAQNGIVTLRGRLAWAHDFNPDNSVAATFVTLPGASFVVNGARRASESALTTASAEWKWTNGWAAGATFEGEFSSVTNSYAGKGVVRYAW